jgi:ketosteroid isomerase-like protein
MDSPLAVVERAYEAWGEHDVVETLCAFDPNVRWHSEDGLPYRGDFVGRGVMAERIRAILGDCDWLDAKPLRYSVDGALVAVVGTYEAWGPDSGFLFRERFVHVWSVAGGRGVWLGLYRTPKDALRALDHPFEVPGAMPTLAII